MAGFEIPDNDVASNANQSIWFNTDTHLLRDAINGVGVITGCAVTAQGSPDMTLAVAAGVVRIADGTLKTVASGNVTISAADSTNPRIDLVSSDNTGAKVVTAGTAAASPKPPDIPAGNVLFAMVYVGASVTSITSTKITDKRAILPTFPTGLARQSITRTSGDITLAASQTTTAELSSALRLTIAASVGDVLWIQYNGIAHAVTSSEAAIDSATIVSGSIQNQCSPGTRPLGHAYFQGNLATAVTGGILYVVQASDIVNGAVTVSPTYQNSGGSTGLAYADSTYALEYTVVNLGNGRSVAGNGNLIGLKVYQPGSDSTVGSTSSGSASDLDATNAVVTFTVPPSGAVLIRLSSLQGSSAISKQSYWGVRESSTTVAEGWVDSSATNGSDSRRMTVTLYVSGLTPGTSKTYKWGIRTTTTNTHSVFAGPVGGAYGPLVMEVCDAGTPAATSGTSFPSSPATGQQFFRTDLGLDCYYDGARWVTKNEYSTTGVTETLPGLTSTNTLTRMAVPTDYDIYATVWDMSTFVAGTNDGTNNWTIKAVKTSTANVDTNFTTASTSADSASTWTPHKLTVNSVVAHGTNPSIGIAVTKNSSPAALYFAITLRFRLIVT